MKVLLCSAFCVMLCLCCSDMEVKWVQTIEPAGTGAYVCNDIYTARDDVVVTGSFCALDELPGCYTAQYDQHGNVLWYDIYTGEDQEVTYGLALAVTHGQTLDTTSEIYVLCQARRIDETSRFILLKYNGEGTLQWERTLKTGIRNMYGELMLDMHGTVQVCAWLSILAEPDNIFLAKVDPDGDIMWSTTYAHPSFYIRDVHFDMRTGEQTIVAGIADVSQDFFYLRYGKQGDLLTLNIVDLDGQEQTCAAVRLGTNGTVFLTGASAHDSSNIDFVTVALDSMDNQLWVQYYDGSYDDAPTAMAVDETGNVYVTGMSADERGHTKIATVCYDTIGAQKWTSTYRGTQDENAEPYALYPPFLDRTLRDGLRHFYLIGRVGNDVLILKHGNGGLYTWTHRQKGARGSTYSPAGAAHYCLAIAETSDKGPGALICKYGKAERWGCARWD